MNPDLRIGVLGAARITPMALIRPASRVPGAVVAAVGVVLELSVLGGRERIAARRPAVAVSTLAVE